MAPIETSASEARWSIGLFFILLVPVTFIVERVHVVPSPFWKLVLTLAVGTWTPGVCSLLVRAIRREGLFDISLRPAFGSPRIIFLVLLFPFIVGLAAYGTAWALGLDTFAPPTMLRAGVSSAGALTRFALFGAKSLAVGLTLGLFLSLGEEIGWRGFLLPRLIEADARRPVLLTGLAWAGWHVPAILSGEYPLGPSRPLGILGFFITLAAFSYLLARVRLTTGSVWPAAVLHATWNAALMETFERSSAAPTVWTTEGGVLVAVCTVALALWFVRLPCPIRRSPSLPPDWTVSLWKW